MPAIDIATFRSLFGLVHLGPGEGNTMIFNQDVEILATLCRHVQAERVLEIGINKGETAKLILRHCPFIKEYVGIDVTPDATLANECQQPEVPTVAGEAVKDDPRVTIIVRPRGSFDCTPEELGKFDMVFIDGDHSRGPVMHDTALAKQIVSRRGVICWHDANSTPGIEDVLELIEGWNRDEGDHICLIGVAVAFRFACTL